MTRDIKHKWFFEHPPESVWEYLTKAELISQWIMKTDFQLIIGHKFRFYSKPITELNFDGITLCEVLEIIPFKRLSYS